MHSSITGSTQRFSPPRTESSQYSTLQTPGDRVVPNPGPKRVSIALPRDSDDTQASNDHRLVLPNRPTSSTSKASDASNSDSEAALFTLNTEYNGPIIPPASDTTYCDSRTLVVCFDGTGDEFDEDNSNVVLFFSLLKKGDSNRQLCYYQSGIGTYTIPQVATPLYSATSKAMDLMFASNLNYHVMNGYRFLMQNYKDGDKICIFGFSRGAYTARSLAGMIHKVGLLPEGNEQQVPFAYRMFKQDDERGWKQSVLFKRTFSINVSIEFVGVWDTVASVGFIPRTLPFTQSNTAIRKFRHACALDERRVKFKPSLHRWLSPEEIKRQDSYMPLTKSRRGTVDLKAEVVLEQRIQSREVKQVDVMKIQEEERKRKEKEKQSSFGSKMKGIVEEITKGSKSSIPQKTAQAEATVVMSSPTSAKDEEDRPSVSPIQQKGTSTSKDVEGDGNVEGTGSLSKDISDGVQKIASGITTPKFEDVATKEEVTKTEAVVVKSPVTVESDESQRPSANPLQDTPSPPNLTNAENDASTDPTNTVVEGPEPDPDAGISSSSLGRAISESMKKLASEVSSANEGDDKDKKEKKRASTKERERLEAQFADSERITDVKEVWFAGCHCDVGGGSVPNETPNNLARIPLRWMIRQCFLTRTGIQFEAEKLRDVGLAPETLYPHVIQRRHPDVMKVRDQEAGADEGGRTGAGNGHANTDAGPSENERERASDQRRHQPSVVAPKLGQGENGRMSNVSGASTLVNGHTERYAAWLADVQAEVKGDTDINVYDEHDEGKFDVDDNRASVATVPSSRAALDGRHKRIRAIAPSRAQELLAMEEEEERIDALCPMYDQLSRVRSWWILEFLPWSDRVQTEKGQWKKEWKINRGRPRVVPQMDCPMKVHRSVKLRMQDPDLNYTPRVKFEREPIFVD